MFDMICLMLLEENKQINYFEKLNACQVNTYVPFRLLTIQGFLKRLSSFKPFK
jgi:hypothetical protein